jgi:thiol-disulfide isomerase/thioredoxin
MNNLTAKISNWRPRRSRRLLGFLVLTLLLSACGNTEPTYTLIDGSKLRFSELQGRVVFINYWAEWCKPCRQEIPELNALQHQYGDRVQVLGVNFDGVNFDSALFNGTQSNSTEDDPLVKQSKAMGIEFPVLTTDPRQQFAVKASGVLPETLVIGPQGTFQTVLLGPQTVEKLEAIINELAP